MMTPLYRLFGSLGPPVILQKMPDEPDEPDETTDKRGSSVRYSVQILWMETTRVE